MLAGVIDPAGSGADDGGMMFFGILGLLMLLIPVALLLASVVGMVWLWIRVYALPRGSTGAAEAALPRCGHCGYPVRGAAGLTCPECGSDYRLVGIEGASRKKALGPVVFGLWWTLLLPLPMLVAIGLGIAVGPKTHHSQDSVTLQPTSGQYQDVHLDYYSMTGWLAGLAGPHQAYSVSLRMQTVSSVPSAPAASAAGAQTPTGGQAPVTQPALQNNIYMSIQIDPVAGTYLDYSQFSQQTQVFDQQVLLSLMQNQGVDTTRQDVQQEAAELAQLVLNAPQGSLVSPSPAGFTVQSQRSTPLDFPAPWWVVSLLVLGVVVYLLGYGLYWPSRGRWRKAEQTVLSQLAGLDAADAVDATGIAEEEGGAPEPPAVPMPPGLPPTMHQLLPRQAEGDRED